MPDDTTKQRGLDDLRALMRASIGEADDVDLDGDILDDSFTDLAYDSLAVLELAARVETQWQVAIPEDDAAELTTPRMFLDYINRRGEVTVER
jgi:minimal PKS acyl carrier protein